MNVKKTKEDHLAEAETRWINTEFIDGVVVPVLEPYIKEYIDQEVKKSIALNTKLTKEAILESSLEILAKIEKLEKMINKKDNQ